MENNKIRIGVVGYGNLGKGVIKAIEQNNDMELSAIFTRRSPKEIEGGSTLVSMDNLTEYLGKIDVMVLCGGSSTDFPGQGLQVAELFNTVDSFDTHARIPEYFEQMDTLTRKNGTLSIISTGWDPGLFSLSRLLGQCILPEGKDYTFWGKGVSQGHSDAIRRVDGVKNGIQYTVPVESALEAVRSGSNPELSTRQKHKRVCFLVAEDGADHEKIEQTIKNMPYYFNEYDTTVNFISEDELKANHTGMPHGGIVFRSGITGEGTKQRIEFSLELGSNPEFTSSVLVAYARAAAKMAREGQTGARTVFDVPYGYLSPKTAAELRKELL
jgi:diaminopimelate dehydrogenase